MGPVFRPAACAGPGAVRKASQLPFGPWSLPPRRRRSVPVPRIVRARFAAARVRPRAQGGGRHPCRSVMECHDVSCFVMGPVSAPAVCAGPAVVRMALPLPFRSWSRTPGCRRRVPLPRIMRARVRPRARDGGGRPCGQRRRRSGSGVVHGHSCLLLLRGQGRDGVSLFRAYRACARAGVSRRRGSRA